MHVYMIRWDECRLVIAKKSEVHHPPCSNANPNPIILSLNCYNAFLMTPSKLHSSR